MSRNTLYLVIGILAVVVVGLGAYAWREEAKPDGVEIRLDDSGLSVERN